MPASQRQRALKGNVTAVQQSGPDKLAGIFPCPLEELPDIISVVLLGAAENEDQVRALASRARALQVSIASCVYGQYKTRVYGSRVDAGRPGSRT